MSADARFDVVGLGEGLVEFSADGPLSEVRSLDRGASGDVPNALVAASRLGSKTALLGRVGADPLGDAVLDDWRRDGVDVSRVVRDVARPTGVTVVGVKEGGLRDLAFYRQGSAGAGIAPVDVTADAGLFAATNLFFTSGMTQALSPSARAAVRAACSAATRAGAAVAFDPNWHPPLWDSATTARAAIDEILPFVSILLSSGPVECGTLFGVDDPAKFSRDALGFGVEIVAVKVKGMGCVVTTRRETTEVRFRGNRPVVDPTGGGDAFNGAFLHAIAHGIDARPAAELAVSEWERTVSRRGAAG